MMQTKNLNLIEKTFLFLWPFIIVFGLVTFLISKNFDFVISFLLGAFTSMLVNSFHYKILKGALHEGKSHIQTKSFLIYLGKMIAYGLIMYFVITNDKYNIIFTFIGIISYRIVLYPIMIFAYKRGKKEGDDKC